MKRDLGAVGTGDDLDQTVFEVICARDLESDSCDGLVGELCSMVSCATEKLVKEVFKIRL